MVVCGGVHNKYRRSQVSKAAPAWPQTCREMVDGGAEVLMKEPRRLPGGGVETGGGLWGEAAGG